MLHVRIRGMRKLDVASLMSRLTALFPLLALALRTQNVSQALWRRLRRFQIARRRQRRITGISSKLSIEILDGLLEFHYLCFKRFEYCKTCNLSRNDLALFFKLTLQALVLLLKSLNEHVFLIQFHDLHLRTSPRRIFQARTTPTKGYHTLAIALWEVEITYIKRTNSEQLPQLYRKILFCAMSFLHAILVFENPIEKMIDPKKSLTSWIYVKRPAISIFFGLVGYLIPTLRESSLTLHIRYQMARLRESTRRSRLYVGMDTGTLTMNTFF